MEFDIYSQQKETVQNQLQKLWAITEDLHMQDLVAKIRQDSKSLTNEKFTLVIVGEFSRGKSTFVNAMLGRKMLPSSKNPTTDVISKIVYGERPVYELVYKDGKKEAVDEEAFFKIKAQTSEKKKEENKKSFLQTDKLISFAKKTRLNELFQKKKDFSDIDYAEVSYPLDFCKNNVEVVDTPGTNDLNVARINITYNYLNKADAAVLVLAANQVLTKSENKFLKERILGNQINDVFIVVNFKDQIEGEENRVIEYVKGQLAELHLDTDKIYLVSSKQALLWRCQENGEMLKPKEALLLPESLASTGFTDFECSLNNFLANEKGRAKLKKYIQRCQLYIKTINKDLEMRLVASEHSVVELKSQLEEMRPEFAKTKRATSKIVAELKNNLELQAWELENLCDSAVRKMQEAAVASIDNYQNGMDAQEVQHLIDVAVTPIKKELLDTINKKQQEIVLNECDAATERLSKVFKDIQFENDVVNIQEQVVSAMDVNISASHDYSKGIIGAIGGYLVAGLLGATGLGLLLAAAAGFFFNNDDDSEVDPRIEMRKKVRKEFAAMYKDFSKDICKQYKENSKQICKNLEDTVSERLDSLESQLKDVIKEKENTAADVDKEQRNIKNQQHELADIEAKLLKVIA